jgi:hypothetical protein
VPPAGGSVRCGGGWSRSVSGCRFACGTRSRSALVVAVVRWPAVGFRASRLGRAARCLCRRVRALRRWVGREACPAAGLPVAPDLGRLWWLPWSGQPRGLACPGWSKGGSVPLPASPLAAKASVAKRVRQPVPPAATTSVGVTAVAVLAYSTAPYDRCFIMREGVHTSVRVNSIREPDAADDRWSVMEGRYGDQAVIRPKPLGMPATAGGVGVRPLVRMTPHAGRRQPVRRLRCVTPDSRGSSPVEGAFAKAQAKLTCPLSAIPVSREEARSP